MASVVFINRFFYPDHSATSQLLTDLAFYLSSKGHNVKVITSRQLYGGSDTLLSAKEVINSVSVIRIWTSNFGRQNLIGRSIDYLSFYISAFFTLLRIAHKGDYIVAKTDPPLISVVAKICAWLKSSKLINWTQYLFPEVGTELGVKIINILEPLLISIRNMSLKGAYRNVVIGETMKDRLVSIGIKDEKIITIPNWSDSEMIKPVPLTENRLRNEWNLTEKFVIGYSGNMGRAHEFDTILNIAESLKDGSDIVFLFIGEGAKRQWLMDEVNKRDLTNVIFKPYQSRENLKYSLSLPDIHLISLLPNLEGLIVPSKYYGVAAAGRPCLFIGDINGEISRILKSHKCGHSVEIGDTEEAVRYILELKNNAI